MAVILRYNLMKSIWEVTVTNTDRSHNSYKQYRCSLLWICYGEHVWVSIYTEGDAGVNETGHWHQAKDTPYLYRVCGSQNED